MMHTCVLHLVAIVMTVMGEDIQKEQVEKLKQVISGLSRQIMLQQFSIEEKIRTDGGSGLKQVRINKGGPENYYTSSHTGDSIAAIHDHSNYRSTIGQGEGQFVLNGVEFRTRHNDYLLRMPSTKSSTYNLVEDIPFPPVPPEVLAKSTVIEQIKEMKEWFKAWKNQDTSIRNYRPYFPAVLCYLEGAWVNKTDKIEEPFHSERHSLNGDTWENLQDAVRFTAYTGRKDVLENIAYLPSTIFRMTEDGFPEYAQWNYRILCHPLSEDLPLTVLKVTDDLSARLPRRKTLEQYKMTRSARFSVMRPQDKKFTSWTLLDTFMSQIPGKDNYVANITDSSWGYTALDPQVRNNSILNVGFYHRRYKIIKADAMGLAYSTRGFSDPNVFMAETTQLKISPLMVKDCKKRGCAQHTKRMSFAIPLEIIYLTPLSNWNPYNLKLFPSKGSFEVTERGKRNGGCSKEKAYNGTNDHLFYRTPAEFFSGKEVGTSLADTVKGSVCVLDPDKHVRKVTASGVRIFLPKIPGIGVLRTRYPIMPVHGEGSGVWKELNALKDIVKSLVSNELYLLQKLPRISELQKANPSILSFPLSTNIPLPDRNEDDTNQAVTLTLSTTATMSPGPHSHIIELTKRELERLRTGQLISALTSTVNQHSHQITIKYINNHYQMISCDGESVPCRDGHTSCLLLESQDVCPQETRQSRVTKTTDKAETGTDPDHGKSVQVPVLRQSVLVKLLIQSTDSEDGCLMPQNSAWSRKLTRLNLQRISQQNLLETDRT